MIMEKKNIKIKRYTNVKLGNPNIVSLQLRIRAEKDVKEVANGKYDNRNWREIFGEIWQ